MYREPCNYSFQGDQNDHRGILGWPLRNRWAKTARMQIRQAVPKKCEIASNVTYILKMICVTLNVRANREYRDNYLVQIKCEFETSEKS